MKQGYICEQEQDRRQQMGSECDGKGISQSGIAVVLRPWPVCFGVGQKLEIAWLPGVELWPHGGCRGCGIHD